MKIPKSLFLTCLFALLFGCAGQAPLAPQAVQLNNAGVEALASGDLSLAHSRISLALEYHPRFVDALVNLALVELQRGNLTVAEKYLRRAIDINQHIAQPHHGLGLLFERRFNLKRAENSYRKALRVDPGFAPSRANLARILFETNRLDDAREQFVRLTQTTPDDPLGHAGLADCLYRLGRDDQAHQVVTNAISLLGNDHPSLRIHHARLLLAQSKWSDAQTLLTSITSSNHPAARDAWAWLGARYLATGNSRKALEYGKKALSFHPRHPLGTYIVAMSLQAQNHPDARKWLAHAHHLAPDNSVLAFTLHKSPPNP